MEHTISITPSRIPTRNELSTVNALREAFKAKVEATGRSLHSNAKTIDGLSTETIKKFYHGMPTSKGTEEKIMEWVTSPKILEVPQDNRKRNHALPKPADIEKLCMKMQKEKKTQLDVARIIGVSPSTISKFSRGLQIRRPLYVLIKKWANEDSVKGQSFMVAKDPTPIPSHLVDEGNAGMLLPLVTNGPKPSTPSSNKPEKEPNNGRADVLNPRFLQPFGIEANIKLLEMIEKGEISSQSEIFKKARALAAQAIDLAELIARKEK